jgi:tRNA(Ser,Leu) C12 N-acetylase TAN1
MEQDTYQKDENDLVDSVEKLMENYNIDSGEIISILIDRTEIDLDEIEKAVNEIREKKNELN